MKTIHILYSQNRVWNLLGAAIDSQDVDAVGPSNFRINHVDQLDVADDLLRAAVGRQWNRGNRMLSLSFSVSREHATLQAAQDYLLYHTINFPGENEMQCVITPHQTGAQSYYLSYPQLASSPGRQIGATTIHDYTVTGGTITTEPTIY
jgi:hypothetical protein